MAAAAWVLAIASVVPISAQAAPTPPIVAAEPTSTPVWVPADAETVPVPNSGDAADDPALWRNPVDPASSLVIGNNKLGGLEVYGLDGSRRQRITTGTTFWGNVDVRQDAQIGGTTRDVVAAMNGGLRMFAVDPVALQLTPTTEGSGSVNTGGGEGLCLYQSESTGSLYAVVITIAGRVRQYVITDADLDGLLDASLVREFQVGSEAEGCLADDATGALYISEEDVGLWRYGAEPDAGTTRTLVDGVTPTGHIARDSEGIALITLPDGDGYVVVSAQNVADPGNSYFVAYRRSTGEHVGSFRVTDGQQADGCSRTDGITALAADLGPDFPQGVFICQDDSNTTPGGSGNQDFKLVRLERILSLWTPPPPSPPTEPGSFVGAVSANGRSTVHTVAVPAGVQPGDTLVAYLAWNTSATVTNQTPGWTAAASVGDTSMRARAWTRTATSADSTGTTSFTLSAISKADLTVAAYRGVDVGFTAGGFTVAAGASHTTPTLGTTAPAWAISYWADKSSDGTTLTPPAGQSLRASSTGTGSGRITAALTDSGAAIPAGIVGGLTAIGTPNSSRTATFTTTLMARVIETPPDNLPPIAAFTATCSALTCDFDATTSTDPDGSITNYTWDLGDGSQATGATPAHTYTAGTYPVTLTVTDDDDSTTTTTREVTATEPPDNLPPIAAFTATCSALTCDFDATTSTDPDGSITNYTWDLGDGSQATGATPAHTYTAGTYPVTLTVTDDDDATTTTTQKSPPQNRRTTCAPIAAFTATCTGLTCTSTPPPPPTPTVPSPTTPGTSATDRTHRGHPRTHLHRRHLPSHPDRHRRRRLHHHHHPEVTATEPPIEPGSFVGAVSANGNRTGPPWPCRPRCSPVTRSWPS